jgi:hypothetical protein
VSPTKSNRELIAFASLIGVIVITALGLLMAGPSPAGPSTATAAVAVEAGSPVTARTHLPMGKPKADKQRHRKAERKTENKPLPQIVNAAGEPLDVTGDCEENMRIAAKQGLTLPDGWKIYCVGPGLDWEGGSHWGVTCPYSECPEGAGPYISISNPTYYVVAHELCHANFGNDELMADSCAAKHGASLDTSPYQ